MFGPEDFESVANEAMVEVLGQYDPDADPVRFVSTLRLCVRRRITDYIRSELGRRVGGRADTRAMPAGVGPKVACSSRRALARFAVPCPVPASGGPRIVMVADALDAGLATLAAPMVKVCAVAPMAGAV